MVRIRVKFRVSVGVRATMADGKVPVMCIRLCPGQKTAPSLYERWVHDIQST